MLLSEGGRDISFIGAHRGTAALPRLYHLFHGLVTLPARENHSTAFRELIKEDTLELRKAQATDRLTTRQSTGKKTSKTLTNNCVFLTRWNF